MKMKHISWAIVTSVSLAGPAFARGPAEAGEHVVPNIPGKSLIAVEVVNPPGSVSTPHHHAKSAFICDYVVSGSGARVVVQRWLGLSEQPHGR